MYIVHFFNLLYGVVTVTINVIYFICSQFPKNIGGENRQSEITVLVVSWVIWNIKKRTTKSQLNKLPTKIV